MTFKEIVDIKRSGVHCTKVGNDLMDDILGQALTKIATQKSKNAIFEICVKFVVVFR